MIRWLKSLLELLFPTRKLFPPVTPNPEDGSEVARRDTITSVVPPVKVPVTPPPKKESYYHWVIDLGHGKLQPGKRSPMLPEGGQLLEYKYNGAIGQFLSPMLTGANIDHTIIPPNQEVVGSHLKWRTDFANNLKVYKPKLFVSIHGNAGPVANPETDWSLNFSGIEVWHYTPSARGKEMAKIFQRFLIQETGANNRGVKSKTSGQFYILRKTKMPAILTENYFYNNLRECREMLKPQTQKKIAKAHFEAIKYIEENKI